MWSLGHCAAGYLAARVGHQRKEPLDTTSLASIFLFSICLDIAHYHVLRTITHSLLFFVLFVPLLIWCFNRWGWIRPCERIPLFVAAASHILCDSLFGGFAFFVPWSLETFSLFQWGSYFNLAVESTLFMTMVAVLWWTGDLKGRPRSKIYHRIIFGILILLGIIQVGMIIYNDFFRGHNFYDGKVYNDGSMLWLSVLFLSMQVAFIIFAVVMLLRKPESKDLESIS